VPRPRAADDFAAIRARLEELRRERAQAVADQDETPSGPRLYYRRRVLETQNEGNRLLPRSVLRLIR
jgi:hypothetical protein